ncbi:MAG: glycoside hydrolase family 31 protein [Bryobacteraceae bacterium]
MTRIRFVLTAFCLSAFLVATPVWAQWNAANPVTSVGLQPRGLLLHMQTGLMRLSVCTDSIIRVEYTPTASFPTRPDYVVMKTDWPPVEFKTDSAPGVATLSTARLTLKITLEDGVIEYQDAQGRKLFNEGPRSMTPQEVDGEQTFRAETVAKIYGSHEALYGLGQHQAGVWNYRGETVDLSQENTNIAVPLLMSSNGYGVFWNNTSRTHVNNRFVHFLYLGSEVADTIDYYFFYGPDFDHIIGAYRELTGQAPLYGKWAYGFWQSKNKYQSQQEVLDVAAKYRDLHIPADNIVQDWFWWTSTGEFKWNKNYPDPQKMVDELHRENFHLMVSIWPFFYPGTATYADMDQRGYLFEKTKVPSFHPQGMAAYDATNPEARKYYWDLVSKSLFKLGVDAWWMDTTEPETEGKEDNIMLHHKLAAGSGTRYANIFPLLDTQGVYEGQRAESSLKRVFILSRSAFAGSQRYGVTAWSGDVLSDFETYKRQIPAGLNFALSGIPYWTTDIGGFILGDNKSPEYRELFVRWFQYGTFCPIFRVHGTRTANQNELWSYGEQAQAILTKFDTLRYRLLPYIYSLAWKVTSDHYTIMRPLVMDFPNDPRVLNIGDQFLFGPSVLVSPVTEQAASSRRLYLPQGQWFDFWTGESIAGGKSVDAPAPLERLPLYVRAGAILPLGPSVEYSTQSPTIPIELRVYPGADGNFVLYEDENDNYNYEKGAYSTIPIHWDNAAHALTIGDRQGTFPGLIASRAFRVVFVDTNHGAGIESPVGAGQLVEYDGARVSVQK